MINLASYRQNTKRMLILKYVRECNAKNIFPSSVEISKYLATFHLKKHCIQTELKYLLDEGLLTRAQPRGKFTYAITEDGLKLFDYFQSITNMKQREAQLISMLQSVEKSLENQL
jgi:predicted transcriptional regulator